MSNSIVHSLAKTVPMVAIREALTDQRILDPRTACSCTFRQRLYRPVPTVLHCVASAVPRVLFPTILERIQRFGVPPPLVQRG